MTATDGYRANWPVTQQALVDPVAHPLRNPGEAEPNRKLAMASRVSGVSSFEDFYRANYDGVYRAALAFSGHRDYALDATQEAFARAYVRWRRLRAQPWVGGWVMTTALNLCRRHARESAHDVDLGETAPQMSSGLPSPQHFDVIAAIRKLPHRQRQAVVLYYLGDYPVVLVAELMNLTQGAVKKHLARAREALRKQLEAHQLFGEQWNESGRTVRGEGEESIR